MLEKIGETEINGLFKQAAEAIRTLSSENTDLRVKLAAGDRLKYAEKIASAAVERGIMDDAEREEYARTLASSNKDLSMVEEFVTRSSKGVPLGHTKVASENDLPTPGETDILTNFLLSNPLPE